MQRPEDDCQPNSLCLVEIHILEEEITIPGYGTIYWSDKTSDGAEIKTMKTTSMQAKHEAEVG